jgi:dTMP kinase
MSKGKFIVLEGLDGSGTTTQAYLITQYLFNVDKKNNILLTREPTSHSSYGRELRRRLTGKLLEGEKIINDFDYWADLFINDREWHIDNYIIPALNKGQQVVATGINYLQLLTNPLKPEIWIH